MLSWGYLKVSSLVSASSVSTANSGTCQFYPCIFRELHGSVDYEKFGEFDEFDEFIFICRCLMKSVKMSWIRLKSPLRRKTLVDVAAS